MNDLKTMILDQMEHLLNCYVDESICPVCQQIRIAVNKSKEIQAVRS